MITCQPCFQATFQMAMKPFHKAIGPWMIHCGTQTRSTQEGHKGIPKFGFILRSPVGGDSSWHTKAHPDRRAEA